MPLSPEAVVALKENLRSRRDWMLKLLDLEQHWPAAADLEENLGQVQRLIQRENEILNALDALIKNCPLPAASLEACLDFVPPAERPAFEQDLKMFRELTILILDWHQKNVGQLNLQAEDVARVLQGIQQERAFMQALRQTSTPAGRVNLVG
jgi:hypothetical protein